MIGNLFNKIALDLGKYISDGVSLYDEDANFEVQDVILGNLSQSDNTENSGKILMSLVNLEQDAPLRNNPAFTKISETQIRRHHPKTVLNLYVLFATLENDTRVRELNYLTEVIAFFQSNPVFEISNLPFANLETTNLEPSKLIFDQYSMTFEQLNHLWGILGGKYLPSVLYKVRLVTVLDRELRAPEEVIRSYEPKENLLN